MTDSEHYAVGRTHSAGSAVGGPRGSGPAASGGAAAGAPESVATAASAAVNTENAPGRRGLAYAVCAAVLGGALAFYAAGRTWATHTVARPAPLPPHVVPSTGRELAGWASASALVAMAGGLALLATRGRLRLLVAALVALAGAGVVAGAGRGLGDGSSVFWPLVCVLAGALVLAAGVLGLARSHTWSAMGARYDPPTARTKAAARVTGPDAPPAALWDALDRGDDPTEP